MRSPRYWRVKSLRLLYRGLTTLAFEIDRQPRRLLGAVLASLATIVGISFAIIEPHSVADTTAIDAPSEDTLQTESVYFIGELPELVPVVAKEPLVAGEVDVAEDYVPPFTEEPTYIADARQETIIDILAGKDLENTTVGVSAFIEPEINPRIPVADPTSPMIAIIIDDLGYSRSAVNKLIGFGEPIALSFLPYGPVSLEMSRWAAERGSEVFLHLPMEPLGSSNPGKNALYVGMPAMEIERRVHWALEQIPDAKGVNNHMGSFATADVDLVETVMSVLQDTDLQFVDSLTSSSSVAARIAHRYGIPSAVRNVFLDHWATPAAIRTQLRAAEREARRTGTAVAIGHPYDQTLDALSEWIPAAMARGIQLVTVEDIIAVRRCHERLGPASNCGNEELLMVNKDLTE